MDYTFYIVRTLFKACVAIISILAVAIYWIGYAMLWFLIKTRLIYPIAWFIFSLIVAAHKDWDLYPILIDSWSAYLWLLFGIILAIMVVVLGFRDIIRLGIPDFRWRDIPAFFREKRIKRVVENQENNITE